MYTCGHELWSLCHTPEFANDIDPVELLKSKDGKTAMNAQQVRALRATFSRPSVPPLLLNKYKYIHRDTNIYICTYMYNI